MILVYTIVSIAVFLIIFCCFKSKLNKGVIPIACLAFLVSAIICVIIGCVKYSRTPSTLEDSIKYYEVDTIADGKINTKYNDYKISDVDSVMVGEKSEIQIITTEKKTDIGYVFNPSYDIDEKTYLILTEEDYETYKDILE